MDMCPVLKLHFLGYMFHEDVPCSKVTLLSESVWWRCALFYSYTSQCICFMDMCTVLKLHFLVYLFHGYVPCSKVTRLSVSVSWICALF